MTHWLLRVRTVWGERLSRAKVQIVSPVWPWYYCLGAEPGLPRGDQRWTEVKAASVGDSGTCPMACPTVVWTRGDRDVSDLILWWTLTLSVRLAERSVLYLFSPTQGFNYQILLLRQRTGRVVSMVDSWRLKGLVGSTFFSNDWVKLCAR